MAPVLPLQHMAEGGYGVVKHHPGAGVAHDGADTVALGRGVAVVAALLAVVLCSMERQRSVRLTQ